MIKADKPVEQLKELVIDTAHEMAKADALFHSIGDGAIATDEKGRIEKVNRAALRILGFEEADLTGRKFTSVVVATDKDGTPIPTKSRPFTMSFRTNNAVSVRCYYKRKDGPLVPVSVTVSPIILDGNIAGAIEVFRDISKEMEVDQMKTEFISIASHQLRTPATAVKTYTSMILDGYAGPINDRQRDFIRLAHDSNDRQLRIVNDLLSIANIESNSIILKPGKEDLSAIIREITRSLSGLIDKRNQKIDLALPKVCEVTIDPSYMRMVIENLISNASKYTPDGGNIKVSLKQYSDHANLKVTDNGVGIDQKDYCKLFRKFSRIENPLSTEAGGSGIGLYLAKQIIELHKGKIRVRPNRPKGTTFAISLPLET